MSSRARAKKRERVRERQREREREERERKREDNTLLHKNTDLSTSQLFYRSVPDDKHSNTQYVKQETRERQTDRDTERHRETDRQYNFIVSV